MDHYKEDVRKIIEAYKRKGYKITEEQAEDIWSDYSYEMYASWMMMPDDLNTLFELTKKYAKQLKVI
jgi:hypothetical protein